MFERKSSLVASAVIAGLLAGQSVRAEEAKAPAKDVKTEKTEKATGHKCDKKHKHSKECQEKNGCGANGCGMAKKEEPKAQPAAPATEEKK